MIEIEKGYKLLIVLHCLVLTILDFAHNELAILKLVIIIEQNCNGLSIPGIYKIRNVILHRSIKADYLTICEAGIKSADFRGYG